MTRLITLAPAPQAPEPQAPEAPQAPPPFVWGAQPQEPVKQKDHRPGGIDLTSRCAAPPALLPNLRRILGSATMLQGLQGLPNTSFQCLSCWKMVIVASGDRLPFVAKGQPPVVAVLNSGGRC